SYYLRFICFFFSSRRRHTRSKRDWSSDVCSSDLAQDFEKNLLGALIDYIPIIVSLATLFGLLYMFSVLIRSYYLYKYSEPFRVKFGYEKEEWYGEKY